MSSTLTQRVEHAIEQKLEKGLVNKQEIYSLIVQEFNIPRPTVRRIARGLRIKYLERVKILQSDLKYDVPSQS